jgi:predicted negative regulator of RcsB-dependent stress response
MKTKIFLLVAVPILAVALFVGRHSFAQTAGKQEQLGVPEQYEQLIKSLCQRGDTNTVNAVASLLSAQFAQREAIQVAITVRILDSLRSGKTNDAFLLLETQLDDGLAKFGVPSSGKCHQ